MSPGPLDRTRALTLVALLGLAAASLQPVAPVERAFDLALAPTRVLPELAAPLRWLRAGEVRAAEAGLEQGAPEARRLAEELFAAEQDAALPRRPELRADRRFVHGEVVGRVARDLDRVLVRVATLDGLEPGQPVVAGDHYVGRVSTLTPKDAPPRVIAVELVTGANFFVGARHTGVGPPRELVVGGLAPRELEGSRGLELAVHNPDGKLRAGGEVRVHEPRFRAPATPGARLEREDLAELASGFLLGELELALDDEGGEEARVRPGIDFEGGLFHVLVLAPQDGGPLESRLTLDTFDARAWRPLGALTRGLCEPDRAGRRYALPLGVELAPGAALAYGGHLVGRVVRVGLLEADARLVGDRGARWAVLARLAGEAFPRPLGELVALGEEAGGALRFRWDARVALGGEGPPVEAELFTGSGLEGVPRGLRIGTATLPREAGSHELLVQVDPMTRALTRCLAWVGTPRPGAEGAP